MSFPALLHLFTFTLHCGSVALLEPLSAPPKSEPVSCCLGFCLRSGTFVAIP